MNKPTERIPGGYYVKAKAIKKSWIAHASPCAREVWDYFLREANFTATIHKGYPLVRGQLFTTYDIIRKDLMWYVGNSPRMYSVNQVKGAAYQLAKQRMITLAKQPRGNVITVCKYDTYQNPANYEATPEATPEAALKPQRSNAGATSIKEEDIRTKEIEEKMAFFGETVSPDKDKDSGSDNCTDPGYETDYSPAMNAWAARCNCGPENIPAPDLRDLTHLANMYADRADWLCKALSNKDAVSPRQAIVLQQKADEKASKDPGTVQAAKKAASDREAAEYKARMAKIQDDHDKQFKLGKYANVQ